MKKLFIVGLMVVSLVFGGQAFACEGPECEGSATGAFYFDGSPEGGGADGAMETTYKGFAIGGGLAGGQGDIMNQAFGHNSFMSSGHWDKNFPVDHRLSAGGGVEALPYEWWNFGPGYIEHGIGTETFSTAGVNGQVAGVVDPNRYSFGAEAGGFFGGTAGQVTGNLSVLGPAPIFNSDGFTGGIAAQGSIGHIDGGYYALSAGDDRRHDRYAKGFVSGYVWMDGYTTSRSWRGVEDNGDERTEFMGSRSIAETSIYTYADNYNYSSRSILDSSGSWLNGGFIAGGVAANTSQMSNDFGSAKATSMGYYIGSGHLGCDYYGYANVKTNTSLTTMGNMNGTIATAKGQATVISSMNGNSPK
jgi:hypothetical protein